MENDTRVLFCLIEGKSRPFDVTVPTDRSIYFLKKVILDACKNNLRDIDAKDLLLWKLNEHVSVNPTKTLAERISGLGELSQYATKLRTVDTVLIVFPEQPPPKNLHIIVKASLASDRRAHKRVRFDNSQSLHSSLSNRTYAPPAPPRLSNADMQASIARAFEPFKQYIEYLATGKLDGYLDSVHREDKVTVPGLVLSTNPHLLLHDLGKYTDEERIRRLFYPGTTQLFENEGAGKTRLLFEGLCYHWGFYIVCSAKGKGPVSGSCDFETAVTTLRSMSSWNQNNSNVSVQKNQDAAKHVFAMLLYARVFTLDQFVRCLPDQTDVRAARRRWVLLQAMPPSDSILHSGHDMFVTLFRSLRNADTDVMLAFIDDTIHKLCTERQDLFPLSEGFNQPFFAVIDEAQEAADHLTEYFRSDTWKDLRPILRELYLFLYSSSWARGIILSGTGLSTKIVANPVKSISLRNLGQPRGIQVFTDTGRFLPKDPSHREYVLRYLSLSDGTVSDERLLERILYWFRGRHRFTASFIELLLTYKNAPRHRVLSAFVKRVTGFSLTDAIDLEEKEDPISDECMLGIKCYGSFRSANCIIEDPTKQALIQCLISVVMRWTIDGQATSIPIQNQMHDIIGFSFGHLAIITPDRRFDAEINYPVYIDEPLIILYLRCLFKRLPWASRKTWLINSLYSARNKPSTISYIFEDLVLMLLMQKFGDKFTALSDVFKFPQASALQSRKVRLVSLQRDADGMMRSSPVSWRTGSSDQIGFKAETPADVLEFFKDPCGKTALFSNANCGPDVIVIFQDEETNELISASFQMKAPLDFNIEAWLKALDFVTSEYFDTVMKEDGKGDRYASVSYPPLSEQVGMYFDEILGDKVHTTTIDERRRKLRIATTAQQELSVPERKTPSFLRIVASPDDDEVERLAAELKPTAILNWAVGQDDIDSVADIFTTKQNSVYWGTAINGSL